MVGEALKEFSRDEYKIATKGAHYFDENNEEHISSNSQFLKEQVEILKKGEFMELRVGDTWYGKQGTIYEDVQATIDDITARYVQVFFIPTLNHNGHPMCGMPLGKHHFIKNFDTQPPYYQLTLFDYSNE